jgi:hypothetical protein
MAHDVYLMGATYPNVPAIVVPSGVSTATFTDVTDTTAEAADVASGKYFYTASGVRTAGTSSGGGSSWELISSTTMTVSTTSTSAQSAGTVALGSAAFTADAIIWVHVRDTEGKRAGYFYGSDAIFVNANKKNGSTTAFTGAGVTTIRCNSSGTYTGYTGAYGVYGYSIASNGTLTVRRRYNGTYSLTVDSVYRIDVYKLAPPSGMVLFD